VRSLIKRASFSGKGMPIVVSCKITKITKCESDGAGGQNCFSHKDVTLEKATLSMWLWPYGGNGPLKADVDLVASSAEGSVDRMFSLRRNELWQRLELAKRKQSEALDAHKRAFEEANYDRMKTVVLHLANFDKAQGLCSAAAQQA